jgi:hypothetical protein
MCVVVQGYLRNVVSGAQYHFVSRWSSVSSYVAATLVMIIFVSSHLPILYLIIKYWYLVDTVPYQVRYRVPDRVLDLTIPLRVSTGLTNSQKKI